MPSAASCGFRFSAGSSRMIGARRNGQHPRRVEPVHELYGRRLVARRERRNFFRQLQAEHKAESARVFDDGG